MRLHHLALIAVAAAAFGGSLSQAASAAELSSAAQPTARARPPVAAVHDWTGVYVGVNGGWGWGRTTGAWYPIIAVFEGAGTGNFSIDGAIFGGQAGFNYQIANWILGVEADWNAASIHANNPPPDPGLASTKVTSIGSVRGRLGAAWDKVLIYATGGWAWGTLKNSADFIEESHTSRGWAAGGGLEYAIAPNWSVKIEYLHTRLNAKENFVAFGRCSTGVCTIGARVDVIRVGLNYRLWGAAAALGGSLSQAASAAELPSAAQPTARVRPQVATVHDWTGVYVGVNGGWGWGRTTGAFYPLLAGFGAGTGNFSIDGAVSGGQAGFNYQIANWILGIEADWNAASIHANNPALFVGNLSTKVTSIGSVRGRLGMAWDRMLVYGTGGWAWGNLKNQFVGVEESHASSGWAAGGGLEYAIAPNWSAKIEYLHTRLNAKENFVALGFCSTGVCTIGARVDAIRVGLNHKFWGGR
jgi:outer membrane immunogenic protein